ncbi:glycosyltransferase [Agromyces sp. Marseille-Q5079]|uniref:glycosyltransferase n=1 Tax=Agromyces sp. Marseille-Q5079 TaxID=3439059 RepID=UPI003D9C9BC2
MNTEFDQIVHGVRCLSWRPGRASAHASATGNFGDLLGPLIVARVLETRHAGARIAPSHARRVLSVGSVLQFAEPGDVVWGAGVNGKVMQQPLTPSLDVRAVRGPLSRALLAARGILAPEVYGDPALLIGDLWPDLAAESEQRRSVIAVPNMNELDRFAPEHTRSPLAEPWEVVRDLAASGFVTGTSLHALIVADALGIPSRPISPRAEDPLKYLDFYAGTGRPDIRFARSVEEALDLGPVPAAEWDAAALLGSFPIDVWTGEASPRHEGATTYLDLRASSLVQRRALGSSLGANLWPEGVAALRRLDALGELDPPTDGLTDGELSAAGLLEAAGRARTADAASADEPPAPLLSVVIPTHDVRPWVGETIASVLAQEVDLEVIVVDDHSTDGTRALLTELAASDPRIRLVDAVTRGGGTARNIGIDRARGRYLVFCDGDDLVPRGAYRAMVDSLEASGSDLVFGDYLKFSPIDTWRPTANWPGYAKPSRGISLAEEPSLIFGRPCWNKVFRREFWDRTGIRFPDVPRSNDIVPMVTAYLAAKRIDVIEEVVYLYRERPGASSMTAKAASADAVISYLTQELHCAHLVTEHGSDRVRSQYAALILDRDGWVHLSKYLRSDNRDASRDAEVVALVRELIEVIGRDPRTQRTGPKRTVFSLVLDGSCDLAAAVAVLFSGPEPSTSRRLTAWLRLIEGVERDGVDLLFERDVRDRLVDCFADVVLEGAPADHATLVRIVDALPREHADLLRSVPELATDGGSADLTARLEASRRASATLTEVRTGASVRFRIRVEQGAAEFDPVLYDERSGVAHAMHVRRTQVDDVTVVSGVISAHAVPKHVLLRPAAQLVGTGEVVSLRIDAVTPEYDAFDRFLLRFDRRGIRVARRSHWVKRAAGRASRGAVHRLRRFVPVRRRELDE